MLKYIYVGLQALYSNILPEKILTLTMRNNSKFNVWK